MFLNMKVYCAFSFELPHRGDSNEFTQHTIINIKKKITLNYNVFLICSYGIFSKGLKNEFKTAVVNKPSLFEPLKFYCIIITDAAESAKSYGSPWSSHSGRNAKDGSA